MKLAGSLCFPGRATGRRASAGASDARRQVDPRSSARADRGHQARRRRRAETALEGGAKAIDESNDPLIQFARLIDDDARDTAPEASRKSRKSSSKPTPRSPRSASRSSAPRSPPDATFTLRLAFGMVKGYEVDGVEAALHDDLRRSCSRGPRSRSTASRSTCRSAGSRARTSSTWRRRSTSSRRRTPSAATRAARC